MMNTFENCRTESAPNGVFLSNELSKFNETVFYCNICEKHDRRPHDECVARWLAETTWWSDFSFVMRDKS